MGKTKDLGHLAHIVAYDAENHITVPAGITMHTNQLVASQAWVTTALGSYALSSTLGSYVPTSRTITINGTTFDLSANRNWDITSMIYPAAGIALSTGSAWGTSITNNSANWNTAFGWGNHASAGYATTSSLSSYLLLAGGTLTGALSGTSALFTGNLRTDTGLGLKYGSFVSTSGYLNLFSAIVGSTMTLNLKDGTGGFEIALNFPASANRNYTFPSANGTIALTSDIPSLSGYVPTSRTLTINGTTLDLSANRSFTVTASETDTLATVTARGATTSDIVTFTSTTSAASVIARNDGSGTSWRGRIGHFNATADKSVWFATYNGFAVVGAHNNALTAWADLLVNCVNNNGDGGTTRLSTSSFVGSNAIIHAGNIGSQTVSNSDMVDGYHVAVAGTANTIPTRNASGYLIPENWIQLNGTYGLYSPTNSAHLYPNNLSYGSWRIEGSRNGWTGLHFGGGNGITLMMNEGEFGFHREAVGWVARFTSGTGHFNISGSAASASSAGSATSAEYFPTAYVGGQQTNPQVYFNSGIGLKAAMTGAWSVWSDTLWVNGYAGADVPWMCALHFLRNSEPRFAISAQQRQSTGYGGYYEVVTSYNIASQKVNGAQKLWAESHPNDFYIVNNWTGAHWYMTSNHGSPVRVGYSDTSGGTNQRDFNYLRINSNDNLYLDYNHGCSIVGVYSAYRFQGVFSMGNSWKLAIDGTTPGNLYGLSWSHPYAGGQATRLNDHGLLVMINGVTQSAFSSNIWAAGDITAYSDARVKDNVEVIENPIQKIQSIRGVTFTRNDMTDTTTRHAGVIAQEVLKVLPEVITEDGNGHYSVAYGNLNALLIEAIKEQQKQIDAQDEIIEQLKELIYGLTR